MNFTLTDWHWKNPNYWCAVDKQTNELIAAHIELGELDKYLVGKGITEKVVYCRNWSRPAQLFT